MQSVRLPKKDTDMRRSTLSSEFEPTLKRLLERVKGRAGLLSSLYKRGEDDFEFSSIVAEHDPSHVGQIEGQIRNIVDRNIGELLRSRYPLQDQAALRIVRKICAASPDVALPLSNAWSGFIREEALKCCLSIHSSFELSLALRRLNDWVPQVRAAAAACIERNILRDASGDKVTCIVACIGNILDARKFGRSYSENEQILRSLIEYPKVRDQWRDLIMNSREDDAARGLRLALRNGDFLDELAAFSSGAHHRAVRRVATRALLEGDFVWRENRRLVKREIDLNVDLDEIAANALRDPSIEVSKLGVQYIVNNPESKLFKEEYLRPFLRHQSKSISLSAAFGIQKLGVDLPNEMTQALEVGSSAPFWAARLLSHINGGRGGELIYNSYKAQQSDREVDWLELSAGLDHLPAINELMELALSSPRHSTARRASKALVRAGHNVQFATLNRAVKAGDFENRGLHRFFSSLGAIEMVRIIASLERANVEYSEKSLWQQVHKKRSKGAFLPKCGELEALELGTKGIARSGEAC